jgi:hypothetical protein
MERAQVANPLLFVRRLWPGITLYNKQREILQSVVDNDETICVAGNELGKDFIAGLIVLWFFLTRSPCRIVTTSADYSQLEAVLWGEIRRFIQTAVYPLESENGGPLVVNHLHLRKVVNGKVCGLSYCIGRVAAKGEGMLGHHVADTGDQIPRTMFVADEASGVDDLSYDRADTWAQRKLVIGNPFECRNFFRRGVKEGDKRSREYDMAAIGSVLGKPQQKKCVAINEAPARYYRKIIRIKGEDSPNVRLARAQYNTGVMPTGENIIPGVLTWDKYLKRRSTWDPVRQCVSLDAEFYEGGELLLYPPEWLNVSERLAEALRGKPRRAKAIGIDTGEGRSKTSMSAVDELGLIEQKSWQTPNTSVIPGESIAFMNSHDVAPENVVFDIGGGGKEHADTLRAMGYKVRVVAFGEPVQVEARGKPSWSERVDLREARYEYFNRRAQMYGELSELIDPGGGGWAIPSEYGELRRQLSMIPKGYDREGKLKLLPKVAPPGQPSLTALLGCSPDEADSVVLAVYGMRHRLSKAWAGAI